MRPASEAGAGATAALRVVPAVGEDPGLDRADAYVLRLPGVGGRYAAGVARHAQSVGWSPLETAGLLAALETRSRAWLVAPWLGELERGGSVARPRVLRRVQAASWDGRRWSPIPARARALAAASREAARGDALLLAGRSGATAPRRVAAALHAGAPRRVLASDLAEALGVRWTLELAAVPRLSDAGLAALRERVATAARCGWCGVPLLGPACGRCEGAPA